MTMTLSQTIQQQFPAELDRAVQDVFGTMLGVDCSPEEEPRKSEPESFSVLIGLAGVISGSCMLRADKTSSHYIASLLTGTEGSSEAMVKDALGEVCNMVAGTWKRSVPELSSMCMLSPPTVISGTDYSLHSMPGEIRMQRYYSIGNTGFAVMLHCSEGQ
jgi:chemotaxis protein CheX